MSEFIKLAVVQLLRAYKWGISPLFPPSCRYIPTCSEYALEAVERYGAVRGIVTAGMRLCRCHPFARGGYDPVARRAPLLDLETQSKQVQSKIGSQVKARGTT